MDSLENKIHRRLFEAQSSLFPPSFERLVLAWHRLAGKQEPQIARLTRSQIRKLQERLENMVSDRVFELWARNEAKPVELAYVHWGFHELRIFLAEEGMKMQLQRRKQLEEIDTCAGAAQLANRGISLGLRRLLEEHPPASESEHPPTAEA
jgi:hypothetical protein